MKMKTMKNLKIFQKNISIFGSTWLVKKHKYTKRYRYKIIYRNLVNHTYVYYAKIFNNSNVTKWLFLYKYVYYIFSKMLDTFLERSALIALVCQRTHKVNDYKPSFYKTFGDELTINNSYINIVRSKTSKFNENLHPSVFDSVLLVKNYQIVEYFLENDVQVQSEIFSNEYVETYTYTLKRIKIKNTYDIS